MRKRLYDNFETILNYSSQDMVNAMGVMFNTIENLNHLNDLTESESKANLFELKYELARTHHNVMQICDLYAIEHNGYDAQLNEHCIYDMIDDICVKVSSMCADRNISVDFVCDEQLMWPIDMHFVMSVINGIVTGAIRYAKEQVLIKVDVVDDYLKISIEDDSRGYPEKLLIDKDSNEAKRILNRCTLSVGLYYTLKVAELHKHDGNTGFVEINNDSELGGGCYSIFLP